MIDLKKLRHELHKNPEISGYEEKTIDLIKNYIKDCNPDKILTEIGGHGIVAIYDTGRPGPLILLRSELDGLPIKEENDFEYVSRNKGVSHSCGHDGHMSILIGVAEKLKNEKKNFFGKIYLLFQPSEENAKGAKKVLKDPALNSINFDYVFGLHNLPGFDKGLIILKKNVFAASSKGLIIKLKGKLSHAGHPQDGNNPIFVMMELINGLTNISKNIDSKKTKSLITIIHVKLGEVAFGTSPGKGVIMATFRSTSNKKMDFMTEKSINLIENIAVKNNLKYKVEWVEYFPVLINDDKCVDIVEKSAKNQNLNVIFVDKPFSWSEDFSYYTQKFKGAFFGLGSGIDHPQLHNSDYDFPDDIIESGINIFLGILQEIYKNEV